MREKRKRIVAHLDGLFGFAFTLTRNADDAQDLVQETAVKALKAANSPTDDKAFRVWLFRILRNAFIDQTRKNIPEPLAPGQLMEIQEHDENAEERQIRALDVQQAFATLSDDHRHILALVDVAGLTYAEAARIIGIADGTVMSRVSRARAALMQAMEGGNVVAFPGKHKRYDRTSGKN